MKPRMLEVQAPRRAFARGAWLGLERLGYQICDAPAQSRAGAAPAARIVTTRQLGRLPGDPTPIVLLERGCERRARRRHDERIVARIRRPASLVDVYRALQLTLERHPRRVPRVSLTLPARFVGADGDWPGAIVSLSEGGCLIRTKRRLPSRRRLRLWFPLPAGGLVEVAARPIYERGGHLGMAFLDLADATRAALSAYVERALLAA